MAECPYCDYEGECGSVEAHISGKSDEAHKGKTGIECREEIEASENGVGEATPSLVLEASESEALDPETDEDASEELSVEPVEETEKVGGSVSPGVALVGATVVVALVVLLKGGSDDSADEEVEESDGEDMLEGWT